MRVYEGRMHHWGDLAAGDGDATGAAIRSQFGQLLLPQWAGTFVTVLVIAGFAAYAGNLMIGVVETGRYIEEPPMRVVGGLSADTHTGPKRLVS